MRGVETKYYVPNPQEGGQMKLQNYRGMLLLCTTYRTCTTILKNKLQPYTEKGRQAGFRQGQSTINQISTMKQILQNCCEDNISVYLAFIDFKQAYDSVRSEKMYEV